MGKTNDIGFRRIWIPKGECKRIGMKTRMIDWKGEIDQYDEGKGRRNGHSQKMK